MIGYGGTYAYKDIVFEFASRVSPQFKLYLIKEFEWLKKEEQALLGWSVKRELVQDKTQVQLENIKSRSDKEASAQLISNWKEQY